MFCKRCRYNLKMIQSGSCPECGRAFDAGDAKTYRKSVGWPKAVRRCLQGMGVFFVFVLIALGVNEVRYQREVAAAKALEKVGASVGWSQDAHQWVSRIPFVHKRLQYIDLLLIANTQLTTLPPKISELTTLTKLSFTDNQLTSLPPEIIKLTNLTDLSLDGNQLTTLPPEIGMLKKLQTLHLFSNRLATLTPDIGKLTNLTTLTLFNNRLSALPPEIGNLTKLGHLFLDTNSITDADLEHLKSLASLKRLTLSQTKVTAQGVASLRLALPNCQIVSDFDQPTP